MKQFSTVKSLQEALAAAHEMLAPSSDDMRGVCASLKDASRALSRIEAFMPEAAALSERLAQARVEIDDADSELCGLLDGVDASPARLQASMRLLKGQRAIQESRQTEVSPAMAVKVFDIDLTGSPAAFLFLQLTDDRVVGIDFGFLVPQQIALRNELLVFEILDLME